MLKSTTPTRVRQSLLLVFVHCVASGATSLAFERTERREYRVENPKMIKNSKEIPKKVKPSGLVNTWRTDAGDYPGNFGDTLDASDSRPRDVNLRPSFPINGETYAYITTELCEMTVEDCLQSRRSLYSVLLRHFKTAEQSTN